MTKLILSALAILLLTVSIASAKTHTITLYAKSNLAGQELKPGDYKVEIDGEKVTITNGRRTLVPATTVEEGSETFAKTSIRYREVDGKRTIREIRLGGSNTKLTFSAPGATRGE
ncbi:MAG: hypothetical protein IT170_02200 [Bryobacterales bacterium]|nr:hypothetical protein [Bryobacterales bacterium]